MDSSTPSASTFELVLFSTDLTVIRSGVAAGIDAVIIDWERRGKGARQIGADTEIREDTYEDLCRVKAATDARVICRVNGVSDSTPEEIDSAIAGGADEILLPMVRTPHEAETVIRLVGGRVGVGLLIETVSGVACAADLATLPLARVFVGLNDLAIERRATNIFSAILDGTVGTLRELFSVPFGFGGLTVPDAGHPVPCRLLMGEMARLGCRFSFLRRSFHRDIQHRPITESVAAIRGGLAEAWGRGDEAVVRDRSALELAILGS